jgi:hypothetical protein
MIKVMKKLIVFAMLGFAAWSATPAKAQVNVNINIGSQPNWGPRGYNHVDYYYLPEVESYYYVPTRKFIYLNGGNWIHSYNLPSRHRGYNLHNGRKVVINSPRPYLKHHNYRKRYASHRYTPARQHHQQNRRLAIRDNDNRPREVQRRPAHDNRGNYRKQDNRQYQKQGKHQQKRDHKGRGGDRRH